MFVLHFCKQERNLKKGCRNTAYKTQFTLQRNQNVGNPDRKEVKVIPQSIVYEWKIMFSGSLLH